MYSSLCTTAQHSCLRQKLVPTIPMNIGRNSGGRNRLSVPFFVTFLWNIPRKVLSAASGDKQKIKIITVLTKIRKAISYNFKLYES